ncbi:MAG: Hsp20/alpha crystallin family protein [Anaerolineae bacterium]|nr:Hsp20/alpha crystallin family protein [Anaerolineae bacterium]
MAEETKSMTVQEQEMVETNGNERMRSRATFIPRSDIYETEENVYVIVDMPGASEDSIDITLEKNILTINGISSYSDPEGYSLAFTEFQAGDYERSFRLTDQIDREGIEALFQDGVLKLTLPKAEVAKTKKISVKTK